MWPTLTVGGIGSLLGFGVRGVFSKKNVFLALVVALNYSILANATEYTIAKAYTFASSSVDYTAGAAINDKGSVAILDASGSGIIRKDGQTTTTIATSSTGTGLTHYSYAGQVLSINNNGFVAFHGYYGESGVRSVLTSNGVTTNVIASESLGGLPGSIASLADSSMSINDAGMVAFQARLNYGSDWSVFTGNGTADLVQVSTYFGVQPAINSNGAVAYLSGSSGELYPSSIQVSTGTNVLTPPGTLGSSYGFRPDINDLGTAACIINVDGTSKIVIGDGISSPTYIDGSLYDHFDLGIVDEGAWAGGCAINNQGLVVFNACPDSTHGEIFAGPNPVTDKIIMTGDTLDGAIVDGVYFSRNGLNNKGQIAFTATLSDGTSGVFVATPIPEPSALILLVIGISCSLGYVWRSRRRAT